MRGTGRREVGDDPSRGPHGVRRRRRDHGGGRPGAGREPDAPRRPPARRGRGTGVLSSGRPVSPARTCGQCHDTAFIERHNFHATLGADEARAPGTAPGARAWDTSPGPFGRWDPATNRRLTLDDDARFDLGVADWLRTVGLRHVGGGPARLGEDGRPLDGVGPARVGRPTRSTRRRGRRSRGTGPRRAPRSSTVSCATSRRRDDRGPARDARRREVPLGRDRDARPARASWSPRARGSAGSPRRSRNTAPPTGSGCRSESPPRRPAARAT